MPPDNGWRRTVSTAYRHGARLGLVIARRKRPYFLDCRVRRLGNGHALGLVVCGPVPRLTGGTYAPTPMALSWTRWVASVTPTTRAFATALPKIGVRNASLERARKEGDHQFARWCSPRYPTSTLNRETCCSASGLREALEVSQRRTPRINDFDPAPRKIRHVAGGKGRTAGPGDCGDLTVRL